MGAAAADISLERLHDVGFAGILIFLQECDAANNHSGGAIGALECALVEKCLLYRMKLTVLFETFNREDGFSGSVADRELAGAAGRAVEQDGAGAALAFAAAVFRSGEAKLFAQRKEQSCVGIGFEGTRFPVDLCVD